MQFSRKTKRNSSLVTFHLVISLLESFGNWQKLALLLYTQSIWLQIMQRIYFHARPLSGLIFEFAANVPFQNPKSCLQSIAQCLTKVTNRQEKASWQISTKAERQRERANFAHENMSSKLNKLQSWQIVSWGSRNHISKGEVINTCKVFELWCRSS